MKNIKQYVFGLVACLALSLSTFAQNTLQVSDIRIQPGKSVMLPIQMNNSQPIVAVQFTISTPYGSWIRSSYTPVLTERATNHRAHISMINDTACNVMVFSPTNDAFLGHYGQLMSLDLTANTELEEGASYDIKLSDVVLTLRDGSNVMTGWTDGKMTIENTPDLFIHDVQTDKADYMPGEQITVSWVTENIGAFALTSGWTANITIVNNANEERYIGSFRKDLGAGSFAAGATEAQTVVLELPNVLGMDGEAHVRVELNADNDSGETWEHTANNTAASEIAINLGKKLLVDMTDRIAEQNGTEGFYLYRSGSTATEETVSLSVNDARLSLPASVMIPQGSYGVYVLMTVTANQQLDLNSTATIQMSADGYATAEHTFAIDDDALPSLHMSCPVTEVTEGDAFVITVTTDKAPEEDITIVMLCSDGSRLTYPETIILPAGELSVTLNVSVPENLLVDPDMDVVLAVYNSAFVPDKMIFRVRDNDMPPFTLELTPLSVTESSGMEAITGYLTRTGLYDRPVTFVLSDDSHGRLVYSSDMLYFPKNTQSARFSIGIVDDHNVNGDTTITVTAAVLLPNYGRTDTTAAGTRSQAFTLIDDDGPSLRLRVSATMLLEGDDEGVMLYVTRNTVPDQALTVTLSADNENGLVFNHSVTIPAGQLTDSVLVRASANDISGDGRIIAFMAQAAGYAPGTTWLQLTDQTLPDARIIAFTADTTEAVAGTDPVQITLTVANRGAADLPDGTIINIYSKGNNTPLAFTATSIDLAPKQQEVITRTITLPQKPGEYELYAVINENRRAEELLYTNNSSPALTLRALSPFHATMQADKALYVPGETIHLTGSIGAAGAQEVELYALNYDNRFTRLIQTAADGSFAYDYTPTIGQCGFFGFGVCVPGSGDQTILTQVEIYGLQPTGYTSCYPIVGQVYKGTMQVKNFSSSPVTGVTAHMTENSGLTGIQSLHFDTIDLASDERKDLTFHLVVNEASEGEDWEKLPVVLTTQEGVEVEALILYYARTADAKLTVDMNEEPLNITVTQGATRDITLDIRNIGAGESGPITFALPSFISTVTPSQLASIRPFESTTAILRITPNENMQLNVPVTGQVGINCANGDGVPVPFIVELVSGSTGTLTIDVCDEYTFFTDEAPHVQGATVIIKQPVTGIEVARGTTDANGHFSAELMEGYYDVDVMEDHHSSASTTALVNPDRETVKSVLIGYSAVSVNWEVVETEIEDEYEIVSTVVYETNVPTPVIIISGIPDNLDPDGMENCEQRLYFATVSNYGLIQAEDLIFNLPKDDELFVEALGSTGPFTLAAMDSIVIPIRVTKISAECPGDPDDDDDDDDGGGGGDDGSGGSDDGGSSGTGTGDGGSGSGSGSSGASVTAIHTADIYDIMFDPAFIVTEIPTDSSNGQTYWKDCELTFCATYYVKCDIDHYMRTEVCKLLKKYQCDGGGGGDLGSDPLAGPLYLRDKGSGLSASDNAQYKKVDVKTSDCSKCRSDFRSNFNDCATDILGLFCSVCGNILTAKSCFLGGYNALEQGLLNEKMVDCALSIIPVVKDIYTAYNLVQHCVMPLYKFCDDTNVNPAPRPFRVVDRASEARVDYLYAGHDYSEYTAPMRSFLYNTAYAWRAIEAHERIVEEIFGYHTFLLMSEEEADALYNYLQTWDGEDDGIWTLKPDSVLDSQYTNFVSRWRNTITGDTTSGWYIRGNVIKAYMDIIIECTNAVQQLGYYDFNDAVTEETEMLINEFNDEADGAVCASISLQFSQTAVFTRQAFRGTLTVGNGDETQTMDSVQLTLRIVDKRTGAVTTLHEFQTEVESLTGFDGELNLNGGWTLAPGTTGIASILFIPTKYAAPTYPVQYSFGGELSYKDPTTGYRVTRSLIPQTLTVNPSPNLKMTYFMQRDVLGDDPLTEQKEPMVESEFALLIHNIGYGAANNMRIKTEQPKIVENEKGLLIDFHLTRSMHNGQSAAFALDRTVTNNLGTINPHTTDFVQWFLTANLMGHFTDYDVTATQLTSYGNPDLSLLDEVTIHELIRSIDLPGRHTGWLCNDILDIHDLPDMLYADDGSVMEVSKATVAEMTWIESDHYRLTFNAPDGWIYGNLIDRTAGAQNLIRIVRQSDGKEMSLRNFWQTHVTLRDGKKPLYENRIHFADSVQAGMQTYDLYFSNRPDVQLFIERFEGVPEEPIDTALAGIDVIFNKPIAPVSFTYEDLRLTRDGRQQIISDVTIQQIAESAFHIDLRTVTPKAGLYVLEIDMTNVVDHEGFNGLNNGNMVYWTQRKGEMSTGIEDTNYELQTTNYKFMKDGVLYILRGDKTYTVTGQELR